MNNPIIIGLGHYSRAGKDTFANTLINILKEMDTNLRVGRRSFASKLKDVTHQLYGWAGLKDEAFYNDPDSEHLRDVKLPALGMTPVELWVKFGTPAVRNQVYDATWVDYLLNTDQGLDVMIIPDVRFPNEIQAVRQAGGHLIKVVRDGFGPKMTVADLALIYFDGWDNVIGDRPPALADGIEKNLRMWASRYASCITGGRDFQTVIRPREEIEAALAIQQMPSQADVLDVFQAAGLSIEEYAA